MARRGYILGLGTRFKDSQENRSILRGPFFAFWGIAGSAFRQGKGRNRDHTSQLTASLKPLLTELP